MDLLDRVVNGWSVCREWNIYRDRGYKCSWDFDLSGYKSGCLE